MLTVIGLVATGCQKESPFPARHDEVETVMVQIVTYTIDGVFFTTVIHDEVEWHTFLEYLFAMPRNGYEVRLRLSENSCRGVGAKEKVVYTTEFENEAIAWAYKIQVDNYTVIVT